MQKPLLITAICFCASSYTTAQIVTDRPDQTESSSTVGNGNLQLETGFLVGFEENGVSDLRQILAPTSLFRFGISKNIELRFLSQYEVLSQSGNSNDGISDIEIGTKVQIPLDESKNTELALLAHLIIPTGSQALTNDRYGVISKISISHQISDMVGMGYNIGYNHFGSGKGDLTYSLALGKSVSDKVAVYIEPYGEIANFEEFLINFDTGFTYLQHENLQFDFSFGTGINHKMNYISIGFSWLIESE